MNCKIRKLVAASPALKDEEDWHLIPDADGKIHLVDIHPLDSDIEPQFNAFNDVVFRLFTRSNPTPQVIGINNNAQLSSSNFNPNLQTRFTIHCTEFNISMCFISR